MQQSNAPLTGFVRSATPSIDGVEEGMAFLLEEGTVSFFDDGITDEVSLMASAFEHVAGLREPIDAFVECSLPAKRQKAVLHIKGRPSVKGKAQSFRVIEYAAWPEETNLSELKTVSFTGPCIDSFKPMQCSIEASTLEISIPSPESTKTCGGTVEILGRKVTLESIAAYRFSWSHRELEFNSVIKANVCGADLELLRELYLTVRRAVEFCIGRCNLEISASLDFDKSFASGKYVAFRDPAAIPDELDGSDEQFVRADDIGEGLSSVMEAIRSRDIENLSFSSSRRDSNILTRTKIIELTAAFESEFARAFSEGVVHSPGTQRARTEAEAKIREIAERLVEEDEEPLTGLLNDAAFLSEYERLRGRAIEAIKSAMDDASGKVKSELQKALAEMLRDSLQSRIKYALEKSAPEIYDACKRGIDLPDNNIGKAIADARNRIAHSSEGEELIRNARGEYLMLRRLVFAMQLERTGFESREIERLVKLMP